MDVFTMVVSIVAMSLAAGAYADTLKTRRKTAERLDELDAGLGERRSLPAEIEELRRRVAALKAIVTDPRARLRQDIDALREP